MYFITRVVIVCCRSEVGFFVFFVIDILLYIINNIYSRKFQIYEIFTEVPRWVYAPDPLQMTHDSSSLAGEDMRPSIVTLPSPEE